MIGLSQSRAREVAVAAGVALVAAVAMAMTLSTIAVPGGMNGRIAELETEVDEVSRTMRPSRASEQFPLDAVCTKPASEIQASLQRSISANASALGLTLSGIEVYPAQERSMNGDLYPILINFETNGNYDSTMSLIDKFQSSRPNIFVDSMDIKSQVSSVQFVFSGRVFCSAQS